MPLPPPVASAVRPLIPSEAIRPLSHASPPTEIGPPARAWRGEPGQFRLGVEYGPGGGARHGRGAPAAAGPAAPPRPRGPRGRYGGDRRRPRRAARDRSGDGVPERARP